MRDKKEQKVIADVCRRHAEMPQIDISKPVMTRDGRRVVGLIDKRSVFPDDKTLDNSPEHGIKYMLVGSIAKDGCLVPESWTSAGLCLSPLDACTWRGEHQVLEEFKTGPDDLISAEGHFWSDVELFLVKDETGAELLSLKKPGQDDPLKLVGEGKVHVHFKPPVEPEK